MKKISYIAMTLASMAIFSACQADMDTPDLIVPDASLVPNTTLLEIKEAYEGTTAQVGLRPDDSHYIVKGRVVSSDASGNIYKSLVIQDETAALAFSLNQGSMYIEYKLGQEVVVDMTGLYMGYYSGLQQVGAPDEPYNGEDQVGFLAYDYWLAHSQKSGLPNPKFANVAIAGTYPSNQAYYITINNFDELNGASLPAMQSQLVELRNVSFVDAGKEIYAPYQESVNRTLVDANGKTLIVRNSGYSNFYNDVLPEGRGTVRGILSYYNGDWQLVLRSRNDVMITTMGDKSDPFSVRDALDDNNAGLSGWTMGYIVGSVKAGVTNVTSDNDIIWGKDAEMDNNLVIASSPDTKNWEACVCVELPQNSVFRYYGNLADNPDVYQKKIMVNGTLSTFLGMPGVTGNKGGKEDFEIDGVTPGTSTGDTPRPSGDGTEANPYNIGAVKAASAEMQGVWVIGYVAGYVDGTDFASMAVYGANAGSSTAYLNSTNVILSEVAPIGCGEFNSIPAGLNNAVKSTLGLKNNPSIYGKRVKVKCDITTDYLGVRGVKKVSQVIVL